MKSEVHSTALCKRITNCNFSCDVVAAPDTNGQSGSQFFSHATLVETKFATQWGEKCCWHAVFTKINKASKPKKCIKHTADSGAFLLCPDSPLRSKQKAKSGAAANAALIFAFAQLRAEDTKLTPTG